MSLKEWTNKSSLEQSTKSRIASELMYLITKQLKDENNPLVLICKRFSQIFCRFFHERMRYLETIRRKKRRSTSVGGLKERNRTSARSRQSRQIDDVPSGHSSRRKRSFCCDSAGGTNDSMALVTGFIEEIKRETKKVLSQARGCLADFYVFILEGFKSLYGKCIELQKLSIDWILERMTKLLFSEEVHNLMISLYNLSEPTRNSRSE